MASMMILVATIVLVLDKIFPHPQPKYILDHNVGIYKKDLA